MYTDNNLRISGSQTATAAAFTDGAPSGYPAGDAITSTAVSSDTIDLSVAKDIGEGKSVYMVFTVTTAMDSAADGASLVVSAIIDDDAALGSPTTLVSSGTIAEATLVAGYQIVLKLPPVIGSLGLRYLGANYTVSGENFTSGNIICDVVLDIQDGKKYYASGVSIT